MVDRMSNRERCAECGLDADHAGELWNTSARTLCSNCAVELLAADAERLHRQLRAAIKDRDHLIVALAHITGPDMTGLDAAKARAQRALDTLGGQ